MKERKLSVLEMINSMSYRELAKGMVSGRQRVLN